MSDSAGVRRPADCRSLETSLFVQPRTARHGSDLLSLAYIVILSDIFVL